MAYDGYVGGRAMLDEANVPKEIKILVTACKSSHVAAAI